MPPSCSRRWDYPRPVPSSLPRSGCLSYRLRRSRRSAPCSCPSSFSPLHSTAPLRSGQCCHTTRCPPAQPCVRRSAQGTPTSRKLVSQPTRSQGWLRSCSFSPETLVVGPRVSGTCAWLVSFSQAGWCGVLGLYGRGSRFNSAGFSGIILKHY